MAILLELERELAAALDSAAIARVTIGYLHRVLDLTVSVFLFQNGELHQAPVEAPSAEASSKRIVEQGIAHGKPLWDAMRKTGVVPLRSAQQSFGGVLVQPRAATELDPAEARLVELSCLEIARALERICLAKQAEDARLQAETEQLRSGILSAVSHDLRTPLATISASAQMLANTSDALSPSARRGVLNGIAAQAERLGALVHRLQVMSRLESSNVQAELVLGDVADVVAAAARRSRERFGAQRLEIVAPRRLPLVRMDAVLLEQVFENLLENAAKFSPDDAPVRVELEAAGGSIRVLVEDQGPGIPDDELEHVFEKFYRGRHATRHAGSGLGLAICRAVVQAHRGSITFERQRPKGACARVELPAQHVSDAALAFHLPEPL
jgi:two-component system sensor histidine kinase KdpD